MKKLLVLLLCLILAFAAVPSVLADETTETNAPEEASSGYTVYLRLGAEINSQAKIWYAWTWGTGQDRWIKGELFNNTDDYVFYNLDTNVVFAGMYDADAQPSWDSAVMWKQSVDFTLDGTCDFFYMTSSTSENKLSGLRATYNYDSTEIPTQQTDATVNWQTEPTPAASTEPSATAHYTYPTQATQATQRPTGPTMPTVTRDTTPTEATGNIKGDIEPTASAIKLNLKTATVKCGKIITLKVKNSGSKRVTYSSSNTRVASVSSSGNVTALKKGFAKITVKVGGEKLYFTINVTSSPKLSLNSITLKKGGYKYVGITGKASTVNNVYKNTRYAKIVSKQSAVKLKLKGHKKGSTTLKVRVNGVWLKLKVKVK